MQQRELGSTGLMVSALGFGAMQVGAPAITNAQAGRLLHHVLDRGITLIDTARAYGLAEERIGQHLRSRRREFVLSTKVGYGVEGVRDWTHESVVRGVENACRRLRTDWIDIVHLHSCDRSTLEHNGVLDALERCRERAWLRVVAYSGENEALEFAIASGRVETVQLSVNVCDQLSLAWLAKRRAEGLGTIAKRPLAERPWSRALASGDPAAREYWQRFRIMFGDDSDPVWQGRALRFAAFAPGVDCCLVGSTRAENIDRNLRELEAGPLPEDERAAIAAAFAGKNDDWRGVV